MATVDKNFRIKNGLVVEGSTATVNGNDILAKNTQDGDSYIINLIGGTATSQNTANTVVKRDADGDFAAGIITANLVGNVTGTVSDISNHDTDSLTEGTNNLYFSEFRAQTAVSNALGTGLSYGSQGAGNVFLVDENYISTKAYAEGVAQTAQDNAEDYAELKAGDAQAAAIEAAAQDATTKANNAQEAAEDYADGLAVNYDAAGSATTAYNNAVTYADGLASNYDAAGAAATAEQNAKDYADDLINDASSSSAEVWSAYKTSTEIGLAQAAAEQHADDAVAALVGSAPAVLDTIQELATALQENPDIISDLQDIAAGKQDTLTAGSNINITGSTISVTGLDTDDVAEGTNQYFTDARARLAINGGTGIDYNSATGYIDANLGTGLGLDGSSQIEIDRITVDTWYDAAGTAGAAQTAAEGYADGLAEDILDGTSAFTEINVNDQAKQIAASSSGTATVAGTAYEWAKADYRSAKFLVKIDNGTHNEISEILVTLDSSDNVAITEYAIVGTNGSRGTITADVSGSNVRLRVTPVNDSTVKVSGTLLA